jgi:hypothetical protein
MMAPMQEEAISAAGTSELARPKNSPAISSVVATTAIDVDTAVDIDLLGKRRRISRSRPMPMAKTTREDKILGLMFVLVHGRLARGCLA